MHKFISMNSMFVMRLKLMIYKHIAVGLLSILSLALFSQNYRPTKLIIEGSLKNLSDSIPYVYAIFLGNKNDSAKVVNGKYRFIVETETAILVSLFSKSYRKPEAYEKENKIIFLAEPTKITLTSTKLFNNFSISGSNSFTEYTNLENMAMPYRRKLSTLFKKLKDSSDITSRNHIEKTIDSVRYAMALNYLKFAKQNSTSYTTPFALLTFSDYMSEKDIPQVAELFNQLPEHEQSAYFGKEINKNLETFNMKPGTQAPVFVMKDTLGTFVSLSDFKGRYVLLNFWASWCVPCRAENPLLIRLFNKYKGKGFEILSVSLDKKGDRERWVTAIRKDNMLWTNVSELQSWGNPATEAYRVSKIPKNFLIDPSGKIIAIDVHGASLEKLISDTFENPQY